MKRLPKTLFPLGVVLIGWGVTCTAWADDTVTEVERRNLIAIVRQIDQLHDLANQAQVAASSDARVKFNYQALHADLKQMSQAIENHLNKPSRTPRKLPGLSDSYSN